MVCTQELNVRFLANREGITGKRCEIATLLTNLNKLFCCEAKGFSERFFYRVIYLPAVQNIFYNPFLVSELNIFAIFA